MPVKDYDKEHMSPTATKVSGGDSDKVRANSPHSKNVEKHRREENSRASHAETLHTNTGEYGKGQMDSHNSGGGEKVKGITNGAKGWAGEMSGPT